MRTCGLAHSAIDKLCGLMNIPPPAENNYSTIANKLRDFARTVDADIMSASAEEAKQNEATSDKVSVDGTWQKFSSVNGVVADVSTSNLKCLMLK